MREKTYKQNSDQIKSKDKLVNRSSGKAMKLGDRGYVIFVKAWELRNKKKIFLTTLIDSLLVSFHHQ